MDLRNGKRLLLLVSATGLYHWLVSGLVNSAAAEATVAGRCLVHSQLEFYRTQSVG